MSTFTLGTFALEHPIINSAGPRCKTVEDVQILAGTPIAAIMIGGITWDERSGNPGETYYSSFKEPEKVCNARQLGFISFNSLGLPNRGYEYYKEHLPEMVAIAHRAGKPLMVNVSDFTPEADQNDFKTKMKKGMTTDDIKEHPPYQKMNTIKTKKQPVRVASFICCKQGISLACLGETLKHTPCLSIVPSFVVHRNEQEGR